MARIARIAAPNFPYHITQRGNRSQEVFFSKIDYQEYLRLLGKYSNKFKLKILSYCLMPNHVHIIAIPENSNSLAKAIGETHRNYTRMINFRENWRGYLWQGRFNSYLLDEFYLLRAVRYILLNPVKANIVKRPEDYKWSSIKHHLGIEKSSLVKDALLKGMIDDWRGFLQEELHTNDTNMLKLHERTGRPLGSKVFIEELEKLLSVRLKKKKPGPKEKITGIK